MNHGIHEASRLLKHANEINQEATELAVKAFNALAQDNSAQSIKWALVHINNALPGAALTIKEKELLS
jgi:hypothetical protein